MRLSETAPFRVLELTDDFVSANGRRGRDEKPECCLCVGDIITSVGGKEPKDLGSVLEQLQATPERGHVKINALRMSSGGPNCANCDAENSTATCTSCMRVHYCSRQCQVAHWKSGHRMVCSRKQCAPEKDACPECANPWATCSCVEPPSCWVCLESSGVLLCGCACRGTAGYVHVACIVEANKHRVGGRHSMCPTCEQGFVGELQMAVAKASMRNSETSSDFIVAKLDLADAYRDQGRFTDALQLFHQVLKHYQEQLGSDHPEVFWSFSVHHVLLLFTMI